MPVDCNTCPLVPARPPAVRVPVSVRLFAVALLIVGDVHVLLRSVSVPAIVAYDASWVESGKNFIVFVESL